MDTLHIGKEKRLVPELRFKGFDNKWLIMTLGDLFSFKNGLNAGKEKYGRGTKFINVLDIINNDFITHDNIIGSVEVSAKELEKNEVVYGDILFQRSSETREEVGQANVYLDKSRSCVFGGFVIRGHKKQEYDPLFMNYLLKTQQARKEITTKSGGSTRYNVGQDTLREVIIYTTSLPEQKKIATFLSAIDKKTQQLTRKKALLEQYKKGLMQQLFSRALRFRPAQQNDGDEEGKDYPDWEEKRLGEVLTIGSGKDYKHLGKGNIPVFGTGGYMLSVDKMLHDGETVFIGRKGTINKPFYFKGPFWTVDTLFYTHKFKSVIPGFIYVIFQQINWKLYNEASGVPSLSKSTIENIKSRFPCIEEQTKITRIFSTIDTKIKTITTQINKTQTFKKGLLQQMFV